MRNLMGNLRTIGAKDTTINFILMLFSIFIFVLGIGLVTILVIESLRNQQLSSSIIAILTAIAIATGGLITVSHTTNQINGTAAQSAQEASNAASKNAIDTSAIVKQVIEATLSVQKQADTHSKDMQKGDTIQENTLATIENTKVTEENTRKDLSS